MRRFIVPEYSFLKQVKEGITIAIYLKPGAKTEGILGIYNCKLKVAVRAQPQEGLANAALIALLAKKFHCSANQIDIIKEHLCKEKVVIFSELSYEKLRSALDVCLSST